MKFLNLNLGSITILLFVLFPRPLCTLIYIIININTGFFCFRQHIKGVHSYVNIDEIEFIRINQKKTKEDLNHPNSEATVQNDDLEEKIDDDFNDSEFINNSLEVTLEDFSDVQVKLNESAYITPFDNVPNEENLSSHDSIMHFMLEKSKETQPQITSSENIQLDGDTNAIVENGAKAQNLTKQDNNGKVKK